MTPESLKTFTEQLFSLLGYEAAVEVVSGQRTRVVVSSPDSNILIGPNGEHLRSLNTLAKRMIEHSHGEDATNFVIDVGGYYEEQLEKVRGQARMMAQRARLFKHDVEMPAMSAYERLVVHELFSQDPEIQTESAGEGKFRHIVLKYKTAA